MAKYEWKCGQCPGTITQYEKGEPNQLIAEFFCPICKEKKRIYFKDLKKNETN
jgi:rubrerythrin